MLDKLHKFALFTKTDIKFRYQQNRVKVVDE